MQSPSGAGHILHDGPYTAVVRSVGASLQSLRWKDRDLVLPFGDGRWVLARPSLDQERGLSAELTASGADAAPYGWALHP